MTKFIAAMILLVCCAALVRLYWIGYARHSRRKEASSPPPRRATLFDVKNFLLAGKKDKAVGVYRDIFHVSQDQALKAVDELGKSLK